MEHWAGFWHLLFVVSQLVMSLACGDCMSLILVALLR
jgi:hypothetical protein